MAIGTVINNSSDFVNSGVVVSNVGSGKKDIPSLHPEIKDASPETATSNGQPQTNGTSSTNGTTDHMFSIPLRTVPAYSARKLRVITIGAGFSGMMFAHKLRYEHPEIGEIVDHTIYEGRSQVGGTWLVNNYPGLKCDVPAHIYAFPFDPNPNWERFYGTGPEIQEYFVRTVQKWNLERDVQFNTKVVGLHWNEERSQWKVTTEREGSRTEEWADVVISAQGFLNSWSWPSIPGLQEFQGHKVHSALWDHNYDYSNKRIAVIGNGSSGIQILPQMAKLPGTQVTSYQRGPTWIFSRMDPGRLVGKTNGGADPIYTAEEKRNFEINKEAHRAYRRTLIHRTNQAFTMVSKTFPPLSLRMTAVRK